MGKRTVPPEEKSVSLCTHPHCAANSEILRAHVRWPVPNSMMPALHSNLDADRCANALEVRLKSDAP